MIEATVVLTSAGGGLVPEIIGQLRASRRIDPRIIALDMVPDTLAFQFADRRFVAPAGDDPDYAARVLEICRDEDVDVVVPLSDEEAVALADARETFSEIGCAILGSSAEATRLAVDKAALLDALARHGITVPRSCCPRTAREVDEALDRLGFPDNRVAIKPKVGRGRRGFRVLASEFDELEHMLSTREERYLSIRRLRDLVATRDREPGFMMMEYLEGPHYSVDVLLAGGRLRAVVVQEKRTDAFGNIRSTKVVDIPAVGALIDRIVAAVAFDDLINVDLAFRPSDGAYLPYEVNPRPSALISGTLTTGVDMLGEALCHSLGVDTPPLSPVVSGQVQHLTSRYAAAS
jgi:carbamoyl-phosphate synthase large subunit